MVFGKSLGGFIGDPTHHFILLNIPVDDCLEN